MATDGKIRFEQLKRDFEQAYADYMDNGNPDTYAAALQALSAGVAYSVVNKCIDPQRKAGRSGGQSPTMIALKRGIASDLALLENTRRANNAATGCRYNDKGELRYEVIDPQQNEAAARLIRECLTDGVDIVQEVNAALLDLAKVNYIFGPGWLDRVYTKMTLDRRVCIRTADSAKWREKETCAIVEAYRAARELVAGSRAIRANLSGYCYIEGLVDGLEVIYIRQSKFQDIGGADAHGIYTADKETVNNMDKLLTTLNEYLTVTQSRVLQARLQGYGDRAIASALGISKQRVAAIRKSIAAAYEKMKEEQEQA